MICPPASAVEWLQQTVRLSEFRGRPVSLAFYPRGWNDSSGSETLLPALERAAEMGEED